MADGVAITAGSGTTIATDDAGAAGHVQVVKLAYSADGSAVFVPADASGLEIQGPAAQDAAVAGNPQLMGGRASIALPGGVNADGDAVFQWLLRTGALMTARCPHFGMVGDPFTLTSKTAQYTTAQTGVALWTPTSGKKLAITQYQIAVGGTTAGTVQLWFGAGGDTAYTRGTDFAIFDHEFAPSATNKPGVVQTGLWIAPTADYVLRVTDSAAINPLTVTCWGYEF